MFINHEKTLNSWKMSSYINLFLKTELTCIPKLLKNYFGNYYNNALCNGATWVFVLWCILHIVFDKVIDAFLKKVRYREYVRLRLRNSLWYLGFYGTALMYCGTTIAQNEVELFNFKKMHVPSGNDLPTQVIGYTLISTFYLHSAFWEALTKESFISMFNYLFLFTFLVSSYILRIVEILFTLNTLIAIAQVAVEFTRCCFMSTNQENLVSKFAMGVLYVLSFTAYVTSYIIVIPLTFIAPLGLKLMTDYPNILLLFLFFNLVFWLITEIYQSVLFKAVGHWLYHNVEPDGESFRKSCCNGLFECSLFKPRDDVSYNLNILRQEIKARETKMMSLRKPKNKGMLIQTLKCMVAIKRKLSEKRLSEGSDSDDSDKSEAGDKRTSLNADDETRKLQSDEEVETDDEESESQDSVIETDINKNNNEDDKPEECDEKKVNEMGDELIDLTTPSIGAKFDNSVVTVKGDRKVDESSEDLEIREQEDNIVSIRGSETDNSVQNNLCSKLNEETQSNNRQK